MITRYRNRAVTRMGIGLLMFGLVALLPTLKKSGVPEFIVVLGGLLLVTAGIILYFQGCVTLAEAKGHSGGVVAGAIFASIALLPLAIVLVPLVLLFALEDRNSPSRGRRKRRHREYGSRLEQLIHFRRNALLGIYFGLAGIAFGIFLVIFRAGLFSDHANEVVLGMFVFLGGYSAVIAGCWWWLKAKSLNEALISIGLMPLILLFIRYVRLLLLAEPTIIAVGMVMMPLILIVVVLVLPDRSGLSSRKPWSEGNAADFRKRETVIGRSNAQPAPTSQPDGESIQSEVDESGGQASV